jgi:hypothetical protein
VALMQNTRSAAAMISMVSLMAHSLHNCRDIGSDGDHRTTKRGARDAGKSARSLHKNRA